MADSDKARGNGFKGKEGKFFFYARGLFSLLGWKTLAQTAQRSCRCPIPGSIQGHVGRGPGQPELFWAGLPCTSRLGLDVLRSFPTQAILWLHYSFQNSNRKFSQIILECEVFAVSILAKNLQTVCNFQNFVWILFITNASKWKMQLHAVQVTSRYCTAY